MPNITEVRENAVTVYIPEAAKGDFKKIIDIQKDVLGRLGCPECFSGRDFLFRHIREDIFVATEKGELIHIAAGR